MKRTKQQKLVMVVCIIMAALMLLPFVIDAVMAFIPRSEAAVSQAEIDKRKSDAKVYQQQKAQLQKQMKELKADKADALKIKVSLDEQIQIIELEVENNNLLMQDLNLSLAEQQLALESAVSAEAEAEALFMTRLRIMEEAGQASYLGILFESSSFSDLLTRLDIISEIMDADQRTLDQLLSARQNIEAVKAQLEQDKLELVQVSKDLVAGQAELAAQYVESDALIAELNANSAELELAYKEAEAAEQDTLDEVTKMQAELKKQQEAAKKNTQYVGGEYLWPVPGYYTISSPYGMRIHPILKVSKMHTGIDIPAPKNTKIVASNDGTVLIATYSSSYGNYVSLDHGGGKATLYAHMSKIAVTKGQVVKKGDVIGYIGSTGLSTGNHLHYECIENGARKNPVDYVKAK